MDFALSRQLRGANSPPLLPPLWHESQPHLGSNLPYLPPLWGLVARRCNSGVVSQRRAWCLDKARV